MWRAPVIVTAPAAEPLSLADAKAHLRVDGEDEDGLIGAQIEAARAYVEAMTGVCLVERTLTLRADSWTDLAAPPVAPLTAVASITYTDAAGDEQTLSTDVYALRLEGLDPGIVLKFGQVWPAIQQGSHIEIEVTAGYGEATDVPQAVVQALKLVVADFYTFRESAQIGSVAGRIPTSATVDALLANYRKHLV